MKLFLIVLLSFLPVICVYSQANVKDIRIDITDFRIKNGSLSFKLKFLNSSDKNFILFKPDLDYVNYGLFGIILRNMSTKKEFYFDCGERGKIESIALNRENYITLGKNETYIEELKLPIKNFVPKVPKGKYRLKFILDYTFVNFSLPKDFEHTVYHGKLSTFAATNLNL